MTDLKDFKKFDDNKSLGVYALYLKNDGNFSDFKEHLQKEIMLKLSQNPCKNLLYIGKASSKTLKTRINNEHKKKARVSVLRRKIALALSIPLVSQSSKEGVSPKDELKISQWLKDNTEEFMVYETKTKEEAIALEHFLITKYQPPFNTQGVISPIKFRD